MLAKNLKMLRKASHLTQNTLAKLLNITREAYSMYESGKRQPSYHSLCILADFYQVSVDYLLGRTQVTEPLDHISIYEHDILKSFRRLDSRGKRLFQNMLSLELLELDNYSNSMPSESMDDS